MNFLFSSVLPSSGSSNSFNVVVSSCLRVWVIFVLQTQHDVCLRKKKICSGWRFWPSPYLITTVWFLSVNLKKEKKTFLVCISCLGTWNNLACLNHPRFTVSHVIYIDLVRYWYSLQSFVVDAAEAPSRFQGCEQLPQQFFLFAVYVQASVPFSGTAYVSLQGKDEHWCFLAFLWEIQNVMVIVAF